MDFSTKAKEAISTLVVAEISPQIEAEEIKDLQELENGTRAAAGSGPSKLWESAGKSRPPTGKTRAV